MSVPDSRKSFLAKLILCGLAALAAPGLFWRRAAANWTAAGDNHTGSGSAAPIVLKPDPRAIARESADV
jgi:hypothetical protein